MGSDAEKKLWARQDDILFVPGCPRGDSVFGDFFDILRQKCI